MTNESYRAVRAYSNSDLTELLNLRTGNLTKPIDAKAARFGTTFHTMILEPTEEIDWLKHHVTEHNKLIQMVASYHKHADHPALARQFWEEEWVVETDVFRTCPETGLPLKCRIDAGSPTYLVDLKTTKATSADSFFETFKTYGYDRQAAFYLDMTGMGYGFLFVGIQKNPPFSVYQIDMSVSSDRRKMIDEARVKNSRLLADALAESKKADGWRPSSWSRKLVAIN